MYVEIRWIPQNIMADRYLRQLPTSSPATWSCPGRVQRRRRGPQVQGCRRTRRALYVKKVLANYYQLKPRRRRTQVAESAPHRGAQARRDGCDQPRALDEAALRGRRDLPRTGVRRRGGSVRFLQRGTRPGRGRSWRRLALQAAQQRRATSASRFQAGRAQKPRRSTAVIEDHRRPTCGSTCWCS